MVGDPRFSGGTIDPRFTPMTKETAWTPGASATLYLRKPQVDPTLSRGFAFPFKFVNGKPLVSEGVDHILQGVAFLLQTVPGAYPFWPEYGCDLGRRVFDPVNSMALASRDIKVALSRFEPRATLVSLDLDTSQGASGIVGFRLTLAIGDQLKSLDVGYRRAA